MCGVKQAEQGVRQGGPGDTSCTVHTRERAQGADLTEVKQYPAQWKAGV